MIKIRKDNNKRPKGKYFCIRFARKKLKIDLNFFEFEGFLFKTSSVSTL